MAASALRNTIYSEFTNHELVEDDEFEREEFFAGERICPPRPRRTALSVLLSWLVVPAAFYGGWSVTNNPPAWLETVSADAAGLLSALSPKEAPPHQPETAALAPPPAPSSPVAETEIAGAPGWQAGTAVVTETVETAANAASDDTPKSEPETSEGTATPENTAAKTAEQKQAPVTYKDPNQKRAAAVGLNPDLSKTLLKRLTDADFRNAGVAISKALAATSESESFTWPAKPAANLALFEVRFVPGAAEDCRRYVVTVTKDRWTTTAAPMEKCGIGKPAPGAVKATAG